MSLLPFCVKYLTHQFLVVFALLHPWVAPNILNGWPFAAVLSEHREYQVFELGCEGVFVIDTVEVGLSIVLHDEVIPVVSALSF